MGKNIEFICTRCHKVYVSKYWFELHYASNKCKVSTKLNEVKKISKTKNNLVNKKVKSLSKKLCVLEQTKSVSHSVKDLNKIVDTLNVTSDPIITLRNLVNFIKKMTN